MQLGFVSAILPELSLREVLETAQRIGYDCVELMCWPKGKAERRYAGVTHVEVEDFDKTSAARINELADEPRFRSVAWATTPIRSHRTPKRRSDTSTHLKQVIDAAEVAGRRPGEHVRRP